MTPKWHTVEVVAEVGTTVGILSDEAGKLVVVVRPPYQPWPHGLGAGVQAVNTIQPGFTRYVVFPDPAEDQK